MEARGEAATRKAGGGAGQALPLAVADAPRLRHRATARLRARRLDLALAAGISPEASPSLALRAARLTRRSRRRLIAEGFRRAACLARTPEPHPSAATIPYARAVGSVRDELDRLAAVLSDPSPVAPCGVAQAWLLLTDGTGPLYNPHGEVSLRDTLVAATNNVRPSFL